MDLPSYDISLFESHDIVRERYENRHSLQINAGKVAEIVSFFSQGRQYFEAAQAAGPLAEPLLAYYGVNALTRGAILFLSPAMRQATLKPSHGLGVPNWQASLATGLAALGDLEIAIEPSGTFIEYTRSSGNRCWMMATVDHRSWERISVQGSDDVPADTTMTVRDVLRRIPDLNILYSEVTGEPPSIFSAGLDRITETSSVQVTVIGERRFAPTESDLRSAVKELETAHLRVALPQAERPLLTFEIAEAMPPRQLPPLRYSFGGTWLMLPFASGINLSTVSVLYLFSYAVGMLARYFPREWLALIGGQKGDRLYPLIREAQRLVQKRFALELAAELAQ